MHDLLSTAPFADVRKILTEIASKILQAKIVHIHAPADLEGILALSQIESACLDNGIRYQRKLLPSHRNIPRDEVPQPQPIGEGLLVHIDPFDDTWQIKEIPATEYIHIMPLSVGVRMGTKKSERMGGLDVVAQCSAIAAIIAPNGTRVRRLRPFSGSGLWLREALDTTFDPIHTFVRDHLRDEGSLRTVSLPEVEKPASAMNIDERSQALSELILPTLNDSTLSTPRLEELVWHRCVISSSPIDIASQLFLASKQWPDEDAKVKLFASELLDDFITTGNLIQ
jgi:hypothetical protein